MLIILGILGLCVVLFRIPEEFVTEIDATKFSKQKVPDRAVAKQIRQNGRATEQGLAVPIPWGWPGYDEHAKNKGAANGNPEQAHGVSESLHRFVDHLLSEKQTVENREYVLKKDASLRAMVEDRYGRARLAPDQKQQEPGELLLRKSGEPPKMKVLIALKTPWGW